jgi:signal transduction histidine kinase
MDGIDQVLLRSDIRRQMTAARSIDVLVRFSRLASEASSGAEILPLLVEAAVEHVNADGAVVVEITESGTARAVASRDVPEALAGWTGEADAIGSELGEELLRMSRRKFAHAHPLLLVSTGGLFGAMVLLFKKSNEPSPGKLPVARALVDLAAIAMGRAAQVSKLVQANTDLRASREALARTEKLRALGQMAAGVSHDLKNILNPLSMHAQIAQRAIGRNNPAQATESLEEMRAVIRRGVETVERLRAFSRQAPEARAQRVDLSLLAREAVAIARPRMSSRPGALSRVVEELAEVAPVVGRAEEIVAAIVNLVANAIDATPDGGTITLRTATLDGRVCITVADTGPGIPQEVQARVFEPFFTTKGAEGTGLGLAMVFATMQRHGGSVSLQTEPGKGAAFTLAFPSHSLENAP